MSAPIEIQISKKKLLLLFSGSIVFVAVGIWFQVLAVHPPLTQNLILSNSLLLRIAGIISILFFGFIGVYILRKMTDNSPGLIISDEGIMDNASGVSAGFIPWKDIVEIKETSVYNQKFLVPIVKNPIDYIDRQTSLIKRKAMEMNNKTYGSPISLTTNGLKCNYEELKSLLYKKLNNTTRR